MNEERPSDEEADPVSMKCEICGKKPVVGNHYVRRGKAKYLGGVGRKVTGKTKRRFLPNLQRVQVDQAGTVRRLRVCTQCLRGGRGQRPVKRKPVELPKT